MIRRSASRALTATRVLLGAALTLGLAPVVAAVFTGCAPEGPTTSYTSSEESDGGRASCGRVGVMCGGVCTNIVTDPANCGDCGIVCGAGSSCVGADCWPNR